MFNTESLIDMQVFSGRLTNPDGKLVPDGAYGITLRIFAEPAGGKALWSETFKSVLIGKGVFSIPIMKGTLPSIEVFKDGAYLEIQVGAEVGLARQVFDSTVLDATLATTSAQSALKSDATFSFMKDVDPDLSVPRAVYPASSAVVGMVSTIPGPWGIAVSGEYVYLTGLAPDARRFQVINVSNPDHPVEAGLLTLPPTLGCRLPEIFVSPNNQYACVMTCGTYGPHAQHYGFHVINVSRPGAPTLIGDYRTGPIPFAMAFFGDYAILTRASSGSSGLDIISMENPSFPISVSQLSTPETLYGVAVSGNYAYIVSGWDISISAPVDTCYLYVIDISNPSKPSIVSKRSLGQFPEYITAFIHVAGHYAYISTLYEQPVAGESELLIVDIENPMQPEVRSRTGLDFRSVYTLLVSDRWLYAQYFNADRYDVLDIVDPARPMVTRYFELTDIFEVGVTHGTLHGAISGSYVYVVSESQNLLRVTRLP